MGDRERGRAVAGPATGDLNLATLDLLGREKDLTYIATLWSAGLIRIEICAQRREATHIDPAKPETGRECKPRRARRRRGGPHHRSRTQSTPARRPPRHSPRSAAAFAERWCLTPADGLHEWRREGGVRPPWLMARRDGGRMAFAALRERWRVPEGAVLRGCARRAPAGRARRDLHHPHHRGEPHDANIASPDAGDARARDRRVLARRRRRAARSRA